MSMNLILTKLKSFLKKRFSVVKTIILNFSPRTPSVIQSSETKTTWEQKVKEHEIKIKEAKKVWEKKQSEVSLKAAEELKAADSKNALSPTVETLIVSGGQIVDRIFKKTRDK